MNQLLNMYWKPLATLSIVLFVAGYIGVLKLENTSLKSDLLRAQVIGEQAKADAIAKEAKQKEITSNVVIAYSDSVNKLKDKLNAKDYRIPAKYRTDSVCINTSGGEVSRVAEGSSTVDDATESNRSDTDGVTPLVADCSADVLQLLYLQDWVKKQGME